MCGKKVQNILSLRVCPNNIMYDGMIDLVYKKIRIMVRKKRKCISFYGYFLLVALVTMSNSC